MKYLLQRRLRENQTRTLRLTTYNLICRFVAKYLHGKHLAKHGSPMLSVRISTHIRPSQRLKPVLQITKHCLGICVNAYLCRSKVWKFLTQCQIIHKLVCVFLRYIPELFRHRLFCIGRTEMLQLP